jgi:glycosyltransferase involved in cell wall biosynthesis
LRRHDRLAYQHADGVLVSSSSDARFLVEQRDVAPERVGCVPQAPADSVVATPAPPMVPARLSRLLHVGGFAYWKGVHAVAEAANRLFARTDDELEMTWVCRSSEHAAVRELLSTAARERVNLRGWTNQAELCAIYDSHGVFLYPSLFDGFGKVFLEAMARGLCVVGTDAGGMPDVITHNREGLLLDYNDGRALEEAVVRLRTQPALAEAMSQAGAAKAREFSWDRVGAETEQFYQRLQARD